MPSLYPKLQHSKTLQFFPSFQKVFNHQPFSITKIALCIALTVYQNTIRLYLCFVSVYVTQKANHMNGISKSCYTETMRFYSRKFPLFPRALFRVQFLYGAGEREDRINRWDRYVMKLTCARLNIKTFCIKQFNWCPSFLHAVEKGRQNKCSVTLLHFGASIGGYYFGQDHSPGGWKEGACFICSPAILPFFVVVCMLGRWLRRLLEKNSDRRPKWIGFLVSMLKVFMIPV